MSLPSKKKSSKREDQRRLATYKVNNCKSARIQISPAQLSAFVRHIEGNNCSQFGIVRLCSLELDNLYPNPRIPSEKSTLIRFAAKLGRDSIVAALIRGGADPTVFSCTCPDSISACNRLQVETKDISSLGSNGACPTLSATIRKELSTIPFPLAVWIFRNMIRMRGQYLLMKETFVRQKKQEQFWQKNHSDIEIAKSSLIKPTESLGGNTGPAGRGLQLICGLCSPFNSCREQNRSSSTSSSSPLTAISILNNEQQQQEEQGDQPDQHHLYLAPKVIHNSRCTGECSLLLMDHCNHIICESCFLQLAVVWNQSGEDMIEEETGDYEQKKKEAEEDENESEKKRECKEESNDRAGGCNDIKCPICVSVYRKLSINVNKQRCQQESLPPKTVILFPPLSEASKECSRRLFLSLPEHLLPQHITSEIDLESDENEDVRTEFNSVSTEKSHKLAVERTKVSTKKSKFRALPREGIAKIQMGTIRSQRCEELWKAATRLVGLFIEKRTVT